jgi:multimeric flavodoxin WrbA
MKKKPNVLLINGSPRGEYGNTYLVTRAFIEGMGDIELREIPVYEANIQHCKGCLYCLTKRPGHCIIKDDDMEVILQDFLWADISIWSMPLFDFSIPSKTKALLDRMMPMFSVGMKIDETGAPMHPMLNTAYQSDNVLISTCGFPVAEHNYELMTEYMQRRFKNRYKGGITIPQGEIIRPDPASPSSPELKETIDDLMARVRSAGSYFRENGSLSEEIQTAMKKPLVPPDDYMDGINTIASMLQSNKN